MRKSLPLLCLCLLVSGWPSCHKRTEEDTILELVDTLGRLAEKKDLEAIMGHFAEDFQDFEGRDKSGIRALLSGYFSGRSGIVVHRLASQINDVTETEASLDTEVALSSGGAEVLRRLVRISPDIYRLRIGLLKDAGAWRIRYAEWSGVSLTELLPESLSILKRAFPNLK
jgi:hypothetical protein